jgi:hypothetical protein
VLLATSRDPSTTRCIIVRYHQNHHHRIIVIVITTKATRESKFWRRKTDIESSYFDQNYVIHSHRIAVFIIEQ